MRIARTCAAVAAVELWRARQRKRRNAVSFRMLAAGDGKSKYDAKLAGNHRCQVVAVDESAFCATCRKRTDQ